MSIYSHLSHQQIDKIISIIRAQCDEAARRDRNEMLRVGGELYKKLKTGRKAHDITGDIYIGFFYPENRIEGLTLSAVKNGIYHQPELRKADTIIHIYHKTNPLDSNLIKKLKKERSHFFCILYAVDKNSRLLSIPFLLFMIPSCRLFSTMA